MQEGNISSWMLVAGIAVLTWILLRRTWKYRRQSQLARTSPNPHADFRDRHDHGIELSRDMTRFQVEIYDFARDMRADIDTKMRVLQTLTRQADQQAKRLEEAINQAKNLGIAECRDTLEEIRHVTAQTVVLDDMQAELNGMLPQIAPVDHLQDTHFRNQVFALADNGLSAEGIANQTGVTLGEVELTLSSRRRSES